MAYFSNFMSEETYFSNDSNPPKKIKFDEFSLDDSINYFFPVSLQSINQTHSNTINTPPSPPPSPPPIDETDEKLNELSQNLEAIAANLEIARIQQKNLFLPLHESDYNQLDSNLSAIKANVNNCNIELKQLLNTVILNPRQLSSYEKLLEPILINSIKVQLYQEELKHLYFNPSTPKVFVKLNIVKSPFPKTVKQHTKTTTVEKEDATIVQLFTSPRTEVRPKSKVKATLIAEEFTKSKTILGTIQNNEQEIDERTGIATFRDLRFSKGTRVKMVRLNFQVQLECKSGHSITKLGIETTSPSNPFVIMTNENQWDSAERILLANEVFDEGATVSWFKLANLTHIHYIRSSRQLLDDPNRPLSCFDFAYIRRRFFQDKLIVTHNEFSFFWDQWFGKIMHKVRHHKVFLKLWLSGIIYGFATRDEVEGIMRGAGKGAFILRFSERVAGKIAIAFNKENELGSVELIHVLFDDSVEPKSLPDYLGDIDSLKYIIVRTIEFYDNRRDDLTNFRVMPKNEVLEPHITKRIEDTVAGYLSSVELIL